MIHDYEEAVELLNWGLENRVMASTLMNITSSRSHTILTVNVKQVCFSLSLSLSLSLCVCVCVNVGVFVRIYIYIL